MRYDTFGNYHVDPTSEEIHNLNTTVPGLLGYRTQRAQGPESFVDNLDAGNNFIGPGPSVQEESDNYMHWDAR